MTVEEVKKAASDRGRRLGILLASLNLSEEEIEAWLTIIPEMSWEQINRLTDLLENAYADASTGDIDDGFRKEMEKIKEEYDRDIKSLDDEAVENIKALEDKLEKNNE